MDEQEKNESTRKVKVNHSELMHGTIEVKKKALLKTKAILAGRAAATKRRRKMTIADIVEVDGPVAGVAESSAEAPAVAD